MLALFATDARASLCVCVLQVDHRSGYGVCLSSNGDVYAGVYGAGGLRDGLGALKT